MRNNNRVCCNTRVNIVEKETELLVTKKNNDEEIGDKNT